MRHFPSLTKPTAWLRHPLIPIAILYVMVIALINPLRETLQFDDWAFALMVIHFLKTGVYEVNAWLAVSSPLMIIWGAALVQGFGFSFVTLRFSTLAIAWVGLASMYFLAREVGLNRSTSGWLVVVMLASPLMLLLTFSFMSDVPFVALLILAQWLYLRAIRLTSYPLMLLASVAGAASILVRQLGVVLIPALAVVWWITGERRRTFPLFLAGAIAPSAAGLWQVLVPSSWMITWVGLTQSAYLQHPDIVITQAIWRVMVCLQYLALFCMPLAILAVVDLAVRINSARGKARPDPDTRLDFTLLLGGLTFILSIGAIGVFVMGERGSLPYIQWSFNQLLTQPPAVTGTLTLATTLGAVGLIRIIALRYWRPDHGIPARDYLLDVVALGLLASGVSLFQTGDRYFLGMIPFVSIVAGRRLTSWLTSARWWFSTACGLFLLISGLWVHAWLGRFEALWQAEEGLVAQGIPPTRIAGGGIELNLYHGMFDAYITDGPQRHDPGAREYFLSVWRLDQLREAPYLISDDPQLARSPEWQVIKVVSYTDMLLRPQSVYVLKHVDTP